MVSARRLRRDEVGQRSETVRRSNLSAIVRELHVSGPLTRSELVTRTGLTRSAIRGLICNVGAGQPGVVATRDRIHGHEHEPPVECFDDLHPVER